MLRHRNEFPVEGELPAFDGATAWFNSAPLTPAGLRGQVVLVSFGTYTCINWIRSLPYVRAWADTYRGDGLAVVGVQTPEFEFEGDLDNVSRAIKEMDVRYPVAVDNDYAVWQAFDNHYWPALYFVDAQGRIRHHHFGEGEYEAVGDGPPDAPARGRCRRRSGSRATRAPRCRSGGRLGQPEVTRDLPRPRARRGLRVVRAASVPDGDTPTRRRPSCGATSGRCRATGRSAPCRRGSTNPAVPSRISSTLAICIS